MLVVLDVGLTCWRGNRDRVTTRAPERGSKDTKYGICNRVFDFLRVPTASVSIYHPRINYRASNRTSFGFPVSDFLVFPIMNDFEKRSMNKTINEKNHASLACNKRPMNHRGQFHHPVQALVCLEYDRNCDKCF